MQKFSPPVPTWKSQLWRPHVIASCSFWWGSFRWILRNVGLRTKPCCMPSSMTRWSGGIHILGFNFSKISVVFFFFGMLWWVLPIFLGWPFFSVFGLRFVRLWGLLWLVDGSSNGRRIPRLTDGFKFKVSSTSFGSLQMFLRFFRPTATRRWGKPVMRDIRWKIREPGSDRYFFLPFFVPRWICGILWPFGAGYFGGWYFSSGKISSGCFQK